MYNIQANASGTRSITISKEHLETIKKYSLFDNIEDSTGVINEEVLDTLKLKIRSLLASIEHKDNSLFDLALDVIYNKNMKAFGLRNLIALYKVHLRDYIIQ